MKSAFRPSLTRRVVLALLLGFFLIWLVIVSIGFIEVSVQGKQDDRDFGSTPLGENLRAAFSAVDEPEQVRVIAAALDRVRAAQMQRENGSAQIVLQIIDREDNGLLARLRRRRESEEAFVANAAHELRTPLAVIAAQAHVLASSTTEGGRTEAQHHMESSLERASHLIHQLLALARLDMEQHERSTVDLAQLVRQELAQFVPAAAKRAIEISFDGPDRLRLKLEAHLFRSILQNIVDNAIRYGSEGGRIAAELRLVDNTIALSVADDGPGIAPGLRERVFDRFQRGAGEKVSGTGLGLAIVRQAATRMGGEVRIGEGLDGRGCRFTVLLPNRFSAPGAWESPET